MKLVITVFAVLLAFNVMDLRGQVVTLSGTDLTIGPTYDPNQIEHPNGSPYGNGGGAAIGGGNWINDPSGASLAVGFNNQIFGWCAGAIGDTNCVMSSYSVGIGFCNGISGNFCLAAGLSNFLQYNVTSSIVSGSGNSVGFWLNWGPPTFASTGTQPPDLSGTATFGIGLINEAWPSATLVGQYNSDSLKPAPVLFMVGNGPDWNTRSNAFEVYADGTVIVRKRQGDILMGQFGN